MERISGRHGRIREIATFFDIHVEMKAFEPSIFEQPEQIFEVRESEVGLVHLKIAQF